MMGTQGCTAEGWYGDPWLQRAAVPAWLPGQPQPQPLCTTLPTVLCMLKLIPAPPPPPNWAR